MQHTLATGHARRYSVAEEARRVVLTLPAKAEYVALSRLAMSGLSGPAGIDDEMADDLKVAVTEACSYFIRESPDGGAPAETDTLRVEYDVAPGRVVIEVTGPTVLTPGGDLDGDPASELGLGMTIIRALVDELALEHPQDKDMVLRLTKNTV